MSARFRERTPGLSVYGLMLFAMPAVMQGFMHGPATNFLQGIYAKHAGIALGALGTAVLITRIFDAVTDPLIGYLSDEYYRKTGSRKPWIAVGTFLVAYSLWNLYRPPAEVDIGYFTFWFMAAYLGWTITEIPYRAWSVELTSDYKGRTNISTALALATFFGTILFYLTPILGNAVGLLSSTHLDFRALGLSAVVIVTLMPLCNLITLLRVPNGQRIRIDLYTGIRGAMTSLRQNRPLLFFLFAFALQGMATGMIQGVTFLFIDIHLSLGEQLSLVLLLSLPVSFLSLPVWGWASSRYQKHRTWSVALMLSSLGYLSLTLVPMDGEGFYHLIAANCFIFFAVSATWIAGPAIIGDIADYGKLKYGKDLSGLYFSMYTLVQKSSSGFGVAAGLYIVSLASFDATSPEQSTQATQGLLLAMAYLPACVIALMSLLVWHFPLTRKRHDQILKLIRLKSDREVNETV